MSALRVTVVTFVTDPDFRVAVLREMFIMTLLLMPERPTPVPNENQELILLRQDCCLLRKRGEAGAQPVWPD